MEMQARMGTQTITQYYDVQIQNPETGEFETVRMSVKVDFADIAKQLGHLARKSKKNRASALFGAVVVQAVYPRKRR